MGTETGTGTITRNEQAGAKERQEAAKSTAGPESRESRSSIWRRFGGAALAIVGIGGFAAYVSHTLTSEAAADRNEAVKTALLNMRQGDLIDLVNDIDVEDGAVVASLSLQNGEPADSDCAYDFTVTGEEGSLLVILDTGDNRFNRQASTRQQAEAIIEDANQLALCGETDSSN